jgi:cell fate (sporulation/competence/biofilm development) regulator YlbF (YheA/YmcA/DUF963 family)
MSDQTPAAPLTITPELLAALNAKNLRNIANKVAAGKTLTEGERKLLEGARQPDAPTYAASKADLADHFGISRQSLYDMAKAGLAFPVKSRNGYNLADAKSMMEDFLTRRAKNGSTGDRAEKLRLECERLSVAIKIDNERLKQAELETLQLSGQSIDREEHNSKMQNLCRQFVSALDQHVENVATKLRSAKIRDILQASVDSIRQHLAETVNG